MQDPRADPLAQLDEHLLVVLQAEGDAHHARRRGRDEQRAERAVDRAIGDIEQARGAGARGELRVQPAEQRVVDGERSGESGHGSSSCSRNRARSLAMPSAALRRAAASLPPSNVATSAYARSAT